MLHGASLAALPVYMPTRIRYSRTNDIFPVEVPSSSRFPVAGTVCRFRTRHRERGTAVFPAVHMSLSGSPPCFFVGSPLLLCTPSSLPRDLVVDGLDDRAVKLPETRRNCFIHAGRCVQSFIDRCFENRKGILEAENR